MIIDIQDRQNEALKYSQKNVVLNKEVEKLSKKVKDQETVLAQAADPKKLRDQRDLLVDLRQKVAMYERELNLVNDQSSKMIKELEEQNSKLKEKVNDDSLNGIIA